jgi:hypothetical protein
MLKISVLKQHLILYSRRRRCRKDHRIYFACKKTRKRGTELYFVPLHCVIKTAIRFRWLRNLLDARNFHNYSDIVVSGHNRCPPSFRAMF